MTKKDIMTRLLQQPDRSFFLFGPRGTGKSTWLQQVLPNAFRLDLLDASLFLEISRDPHRLEALIGGQAAGGNFAPNDNSGNIVPGNINLTLSDGTNLSNYYLNVGDFRGFTSNIPITSMSVSTLDLTNSSYPTVDHFYVGSQVPIPAAVWLLGTGLVGLFGIRRRFAS